MGMSLPGRVAVLVAIFLVICTVTAYVAFLVSNKRADYALWFSWQRILLIVILLIAIPLVIHRALKLWLEGDVSEFPDIDYAWREGITALGAHGLDLSSIPIFLIVGARDDVQAKSLLDSSRLSLRVRDVPQGPAALHWYADPDAIYLVCTETCRLGKLAKKAAVAPGPGAPTPSYGAGTSASGLDPLRGTIVPGGGDEPADSALPPQPGPDATTAHPSFTGAMDIRGTMVADAGSTEAEDVAAPSAPAGPITLSPGEAAEQTARLEHVCRLLRRARQPLCPINGMMTLLPFDAIQRGPRDAIEIQRAAKEDIATVHRVTKLRCPVSAVVVGMETQSGFHELVRRVGPDRAKAQRFGKGFTVWNPPIPERVEALGTHACGAFEDWVYALFREKEGLYKPGNTKLYALLCKIRSDLRSRLTNILVAGYAHDPEESPGEEPMLFSGCYFAATGETEDRQAFVKSVFEKLLDEESELQWCKEALAEDDRYQGLARLVMAVDGLLAAGLIGALIYWFWMS